MNNQERPFDFDVWLEFSQEFRTESITWLLELTGRSKIDCARIVLDSIKNSKSVMVIYGTGWDDVQDLLRGLPNYIKPKVYQSSYGPSDYLDHCDRHNLYYAAQSCPVCDGFFISQVRGGQRFV